MSTAVSIRRWFEDDWSSFREARLFALKTNPSVFLDDADIVANHDAEFWRAQLRDVNDSAIFGLYDLNQIIGLTGVFRLRESPLDTAIFGMSFISPAYRGRGLSDEFYKARIDWVKGQTGLTKIIANHREGNEASRAAILKWGFVFCDTETITYGDGTQNTRYKYELRLDKS